MARKRKMSATAKQRRRERRRARVPSLLKAASRHGEQIVVTGRAP
jgi:hypothetical protein